MEDTPKGRGPGYAYWVGAVAGTALLGILGAAGAAFVAWRSGWRKIAAGIAGAGILWTLGIVLVVASANGGGPLPAPSCTVGVNGTTLAVTVTGTQARSRCSAILSAWHSASVAGYRESGQPGEPVVCKVSANGATVTVEDTGSQADGQAFCASLEKAAG